MAICVSNAKPFIPSLPSSSSPFPLHTQKLNSWRKPTLCRSVKESPFPHPNLISRRRSLSLCLTTSFLLSLGGSHGSLEANAAILEAEDDEELLQKVKMDKKKRVERQGLISSSGKETAHLQDLVYKLNRIGEAIDKNDLPAASGVLGQDLKTDWVKNVNSALDKFSISPQEKAEVDAFSSSLASLISSVEKKDFEASRVAFVASATAFEKWTTLTGLARELKGI
ncbi:unnamed protein product [Cuscuta campestris]|uniref:Maintenance of Photosystem II under High light 2 C-terminal domain-containing protein n=1 Tax=Cuscuta campestris TaxID=132261 RepID=A0A484LB32_9ASTE|nr:unnamed protein product [Cuscuta campestris]